MLNEFVYLVVVTYNDGSTYNYEAYSLDDALKFYNNFDKFCYSVQIYKSVCIRERISEE